MEYIFYGSRIISEYDSEDDRQKSEHHRKKKRKDKDREEEEEEGEIRKVKVEIKQDYDDVWHPGDDRRDFESKRLDRAKLRSTL